MANKPSEITVRYRQLAFLFSMLGFIVSVGPFLSYFIYGFIVAETAQKMTLAVSALAAGGIALVNIITKVHLRCPLWILLLALYLVLDNLYVLLIIAAIGCILDELVFTPLANSYRGKATINYEIDKRG